MVVATIIGNTLYNNNSHLSEKDIVQEYFFGTSKPNEIVNEKYDAKKAFELGKFFKGEPFTIKRFWNTQRVIVKSDKNMFPYIAYYSENEISNFKYLLTRVNEHFLYYENSGDEGIFINDTLHYLELMDNKVKGFKIGYMPFNDFEREFIINDSSITFRLKHADESANIINDVFKLKDTLKLKNLLDTSQVTKFSVFTLLNGREINYVDNYLNFKYNGQHFYVDTIGEGYYFTLKGDTQEFKRWDYHIYVYLLNTNTGFEIWWLNLRNKSIRLFSKIPLMEKAELCEENGVFLKGNRNDSVFIYEIYDLLSDSIGNHSNAEILLFSYPLTKEQSNKSHTFHTSGEHAFWVYLRGHNPENKETQLFVSYKAFADRWEWDTIKYEFDLSKLRYINYGINKITAINDHTVITYANGKQLPSSYADSNFVSLFREKIESYSQNFPNAPIIISLAPEIFLLARKNSDGDYEFKIFGTNLKLPEKFFTATIEYDPYIITILIAFLTVLYFLGRLALLDIIEGKNLKFNEKYLDRIPSLKRKIQQIEAIAGNLKTWSNTMLGLGIIFGVGGLVTFYIVIGINFDSTQKYDWHDAGTILNLLRPTLLLIFIETFTFFFLKQYRVIFNEYKLFYSVYLRLYNYFHLIEIEPGDKISDEMTKIIIEKLKDEKFDLYESNKTVNEFDNELLLKVLKKLSDKVGN